MQVNCEHMSVWNMTLEETHLSFTVSCKGSIVRKRSILLEIQQAITLCEYRSKIAHIIEFVSNYDIYKDTKPNHIRSFLAKAFCQQVWIIFTNIRRQFYSRGPTLLIVESSISFIRRYTTTITYVNAMITFKIDFNLAKTHCFIHFDINLKNPTFDLKIFKLFAGGLMIEKFMVSASG